MAICSERDPADALRLIAESFEGEAAALTRVAADVRNPLLAEAMRRGSAVLSALSLAFGECATQRTHAPMEDLSERCGEWVDETLLFEPVPVPTIVELTRLADDGNPHAATE